jgi:hypothetical protein
MERRKFTVEFKAEAVRQALLPGVSKAQVAPLILRGMGYRASWSGATASLLIPCFLW